MEVEAFLLDSRFLILELLHSRSSLHPYCSNLRGNLVETVLDALIETNPMRRSPKPTVLGIRSKAFVDWAGQSKPPKPVNPKPQTLNPKL